MLSSVEISQERVRVDLGDTVLLDTLRGEARQCHVHRDSPKLHIINVLLDKGEFREADMIKELCERNPGMSHASARANVKLIVNYLAQLRP